MSEHTPSDSDQRILFYCKAGPRREAFRAITSAAGLEMAYEDPSPAGGQSVAYWKYDLVWLDLSLNDTSCEFLVSLLRGMENVRGQIHPPLVGIANPADLRVQVDLLAERADSRRVA